MLFVKQFEFTFIFNYNAKLTVPCEQVIRMGLEFRYCIICLVFERSLREYALLLNCNVQSSASICHVFYFEDEQEKAQPDLDQMSTTLLLVHNSQCS